MAIILASASPRRSELLKQAGCKFEIRVSHVEEKLDSGCPPEKLAVTLASKKALAVAAEAEEDDVVIGADTMVVLRGTVYGKPTDREDACRMLSELSGQEHQVITGVAVVRGTGLWTDFSTTTVRMSTLTPERIQRYIATGEPFGKAGSYAIQGIGALLVEHINGCYNNVVGLPLMTLASLLERAGVELL